MPQKKIVRFYEPVKLNQKDKAVTIGTTFWTTLLDKLTHLSHKDRIFAHGGVDYYGEALRAQKSPSRRYLHAGRLRDRDDWPDSFEPTSGQVTPLTINGLLLEPTFVVPFGSLNYCAVLTPRLGGIRASALERWLTGACGLLGTNERIELRPIINRDVAAKLNNVAIGASTLSVRFRKDVDFGNDTGGGEVGAAMRGAAAATTDDMSAELRFSFGHAAGSHEGQRALLRAAQWLARRSYADKAKVSMLIPYTDAENNSESVRVEAHDLLKDQVTYNVPIDVSPGQALSESSVMGAIELAIEQFNAEH